MKIPSKNRMHNIYKKALVGLEKDIKQFESIKDYATWSTEGICYYISDALYKHYGEHNISSLYVMKIMPTYFPELYAKKPRSNSGMYWWITTNYQKRVEVLQECIKETE